MKRTHVLIAVCVAAMMVAVPAMGQVPVSDEAIEDERSERDTATTEIGTTDSSRAVVSTNITCSMYRPSTRDDPNDAMARNPEIAGLIRRIAREEGVDESTFMALVYQESRLNPCVGSSAGAYGLAQLMPGTADDLGVNRHNIEQNLRGGARYFRRQLNAHGGNVSLALAAYNAGPGNVSKYGGIPPFKETHLHSFPTRRSSDLGPGNVSKYGGIPPFKETQDYVRNITTRWMPALGGADMSSIPLNYGGGSSGYTNMRDATLNAMGASQGASANLGNVASWLTQLGQQQPGTMIESFDHNSTARNANLELFNQAIGMAAVFAELLNSKNAMQLTDQSSTAQSLNPTPKPAEPDPTEPVENICDEPGTAWDEETKSCVAELEPTGRVTLQLTPEL